MRSSSAEREDGTRAPGVHRVQPSVVAFVVVFVFRRAADAGEAARVVRIADALVTGHRGPSAERTRQLDRARCRRVVGVLGRHHPLGGVSVLDPVLERRLDVVHRVAHRRDLLPDGAEARRSRAEVAVRHPRHHEQAIELLRLPQTAHRLDHRLVVFGAVLRL